MSATLRQLEVEHKNIARLLQALERQLGLFDRLEQPDYDILLSIADYFTGFPDRYHHPKEDLILRKLQQRNPAAAKSVERLDAEHERIGELARQFRAAIANVLKEVEIPRSNVDAVIRHFIDDQRKHMQMEEQFFFPLARDLLTPEDWAAVDAEAGREEDPLFGAEVARDFQALSNDILSWEREDQVT